MSKADYIWGHAKLEEFIYWMVERHAIWKKRDLGECYPWTEDPILRERKFTNVFRELDKGTLALRGMIDAFDGIEHPEDITFNIIWYRLFNRYEHAVDIGYHRTLEFEAFREKVLDLASKGTRMFTSAHMTYGKKDERKVDTNLDTLSNVIDRVEQLTADLMACSTLEKAFKVLRSYRFAGIGPFIAGIGPFIGYEIISDLRWYYLADTTDRCSWANLGPGCKRGMERLGRQLSQESLRKIRADVVTHADFAPLRVHADGVWPPFEMREIEHSLCEFDKYCRGGGKEKYRA
jgi:hypothetical protein